MVLEMVRNIPAVGDRDWRLKSTAELHSRIEELERLKDHMESVGMSIVNAVSDGTLILNHNTDAFLQGIYARDLQSEFENVKSTEGVDSAQAATATLHNDWLVIKSGDVGVQKSLSKLFSSKERVERKSYEAFERYYKQGEPRKNDNQADLRLIQICQI